jgi:hypothetical protein
MGAGVSASVGVASGVASIPCCKFVVDMKDGTGKRKVQMKWLFSYPVTWFKIANGIT